MKHIAMSDAPKPISDDIAAMAFVQASHLCNGLSAETLDKLLTAGELLEYAPAEVVIQEGGQDQHLFVVLDGAVSVQKSTDGESVEVAVLERSGVFGENAALTGQARSASVVSTTDTRLVRFPGDVVRQVAEEVPKFGRLLATLMAGRAKDTEKKLSEPPVDRS